MKTCLYTYKLLFGLALLQLATSTASAQIVTISETLKRMSADALRIGLPVQASESLALGKLCPGKSACISMPDGVLLDMKLMLFPSDMAKSPNVEVYDFIERYLFSLLLKQTRNEQLYLLQEDFVSLKVNGKLFRDSPYSIASVLQMIQPETPFSLTMDDFHYHASWSTDSKAGKITLSFPKQYDLILGRDKKELTLLMKGELQRFLFTEEHYSVGQPLLPWESSALVYSDMLDYYVLPQVRRGRYLQRKGNTYTYVFSERLMEESILNLFSHADKMNNAGEKEIHLAIRGYNCMDSLYYTTDRLCAYMKAHHNLAYIGVEEVTETFVTGTAFYVNRELGYKHLLYFKIPRDIFTKNNVLITASLYPYIPIGNIGNLYDNVPDLKK